MSAESCISEYDSFHSFHSQLGDSPSRVTCRPFPTTRTRVFRPPIRSQRSLVARPIHIHHRAKLECGAHAGRISIHEWRVVIVRSRAEDHFERQVERLLEIALL
jgi:hypothetical protein